MTEDNNDEKVIEDMNAFITETTVLVERVMKMRVQCKEMQMKMLQLFHPSCLKTLQTLNEISLRNFKRINRNEIGSNRNMNIMQIHKEMADLVKDKKK